MIMFMFITRKFFFLSQNVEAITLEIIYDD